MLSTTKQLVVNSILLVVLLHAKISFSFTFGRGGNPISPIISIARRAISPLKAISVGWKQKVDSDEYAVTIGWKQTPDKEDGVHYAHDEVTYRIRSGEVLHIPQAERYSTRDWFHNLKTMPTSRLLNRIRGVVFASFLWSCSVYAFHRFVFSFQAPGSRCHALLGSALGLLLVFRTNSAYNRFWEGRKIWERILTSLRDLGRNTMIYADIIKSEKVERMFHLLCAFPLILQEHVQGFRHPSQLSSLLPAEEIRQLDRVTNRPYYILNKISKEIRLIPDGPEFTSRERQTMQKYVDDLSRMLGAAERIVQTPVPLTYARHTSRFLSLFCLTAPIALVGELGAYIIPFVTLVAWALFGIQEIGLMIEEPFQRALRLEVFANTIRRDLSDLLHVTSVSPTRLHIESEALGYEVPFSCRLDAVSKLLDEKALTPQEMHKEIEKWQKKDSARLHGNDPFDMPQL